MNLRLQRSPHHQGHELCLTDLLQQLNADIQLPAPIDHVVELVDELIGHCALTSFPRAIPHRLLNPARPPYALRGLPYQPSSTFSRVTGLQCDA